MVDLNIYNIIIIFITLSFLFQVILDKIQVKYLIKNINFIPERFKVSISIDDHKKSIEYAKDKLDHRIKRNIVEVLFLGVLTFGGFLDGLTQYVFMLSLSLEIDAVLAGSLLVLFFYCIVFLVDVPFSLYKQFVIEERHGFNKMTFALWLTDLAKNAALSSVLIFPVIYLVLFLITSRVDIGPLWWILLWALVVLLSVSFMIIFPLIIAPIFNKFSPIENGRLKERLEKLLTRCKFKSKGLFTMDGSKRSSHGNAYFAGIGGAKRIVLFDTLIEKLNEKEIEAVLAHEVGHYKCGHIPLRLMQSALMSFGFFFFLGLFIDEQLFFLSFGMSIETTNLIGNSGILSASFFIVFFYILPNALFPLRPLIATLSRKHEFEADSYAAKNAEASQLISALIKLYKENSAPVITNKWFSLFYDSHPNALARIDALE
ncbi:M48 family metallopeptidase [Betaproteobacteria bacterium]|nr:M48 family metallopeptidase [Betaproteobacteria bacterium]